MIVIKNKIKGVFLIKPEPFKDKRGIFRRIFCQKEFKKNNLVNIIRQSNISENKFRYKKSELKWWEGNEKYIWQYIIDQEI